MKRREYFFVRKENTNTLFNNSSHLHHRSGILENIHWTQTAYAVSVSAAPQGYAVFVQIKRKERKRRIRVVRLIYAICVQWILSKMVQRWRRWDKMLNKVVIFIFFAYKKYSRHFIKGLDSVIYLAVNGTVTSLPVFIQNILNCVLNKAFMGLEQHGGKWLTKFSFWGRVTR